MKTETNFVYESFIFTTLTRMIVFRIIQHSDWVFHIDFTQRIRFPDFSLPSFEILTWIWHMICHDIIQLKIEFCHARLNFTGVIALCYYLVFQTFLCRLLRYWLEIWYMNLSRHNTVQVWVLSCLTYFYRSYCFLLKFSFPDFSLSSFEILTWIWYMNLSWHNTAKDRVLSR